MYEEKPKGKPKRGEYDELANVGARLIALMIDNIMLAILTAVLFAFVGEPGVAGGFLVGLLYQWYFLTQRDGQTLGKHAVGIRVVRVTGEPLDFATVLVRYVGTYINSFIFGIGWLWALFNEDRQGWHDLMAGTYVVKA